MYLVHGFLTVVNVVSGFIAHLLYNILGIIVWIIFKGTAALWHLTASTTSSFLAHHAILHGFLTFALICAALILVAAALYYLIVGAPLIAIGIVVLSVVGTVAPVLLHLVVGGVLLALILGFIYLLFAVTLGIFAHPKKQQIISASTNKSGSKE